MPQYSQESTPVRLFLIKLQAFRPPTQVFSSECCDFFKNSFFYRKPLVAGFLSTQKGRGKKQRIEGWGKFFQMTEENENISYSFYLQVLVLVKTEMQIQLCKYCRTAHHFFLTLSSNFLFCDSCVFIFYVFIPGKLKKYLLLHLLVYS